MLDAAYRHLFARHFDWAGWEQLIEQNGLTIDRPYQSHHPRYPEIVYPMDYGYVNGTLSSDGAEVDVFRGSSRSGLAAVLLTRDHRQGDREANLLYNCRPEEIYLAHGFVNYDRTLLEGLLVMRWPMETLWEET